jgi:hypothetical protein
MTGPLTVLSVGSLEACTLVRDALRLSHESRFWAAREYSDVLNIRETARFAVAVLEASIPVSHLRQTAEYIRRKWPRTVIVLLGDSAEGLDDALYDHRVPRSATPDALFTVIHWLAHGTARETQRY